MLISFKLTDKHYKEFRRSYFATLAGFWDRKHFIIFSSFGIVVTVAGLNWIFSRQSDTLYGFFCVVLGLCLILRGLWFRYWQGVRQFSRDQLKVDSLQVEIDLEGFIWRSQTEAVRVHWAHYSRFYESKNLFVLVDSTNASTIIPKLAFAPDELSCFRTWVHDKLARAPR